MNAAVSTEQAVARLADVRARLAVEAPVARTDGLPDEVRRALDVAERLGAPRLSALDTAVLAVESRRETERAVAVAGAQARTVATVLTALPVVLLLGLDRFADLPVLEFYATAAGAPFLLVGLVLLAGGVGLMRGLSAHAAGAAVRRAEGRTGGRRRAPWIVAGLGAAILVHPLALAMALPVLTTGTRRPRPVAPEVAELLVVALRAGVPVGVALRAVADVLPEHRAAVLTAALGHDLNTAPTADGPLGPVLDVVGAAARQGASPIPALARLAADQRAELHAAAMAAAQRLPALLTFPTALLLLPATVVLTGGPLLMELIRQWSAT